MQKINFWNGNKSAVRRAYELALLQACLNHANGEVGQASLIVDDQDYPSAEDEGNIFASGADILVTVAGNLKFEGKKKIMISQPVAKGLLGYRLLLSKDESLATFAQISQIQQLQSLSIGIPHTWADAALFRHNQFRVIERGSLEELFLRLKSGEFDYVALGVNEIEEIFNSRVLPIGGISIVPTLMVYYPFPLVFYIAPDQPILAQQVQAGLDKIVKSGEFELLFARHHPNVVRRLNLHNRLILTLANPMLPADMRNFRGTLLD